MKHTKYQILMFFIAFGVGMAVTMGNPFVSIVAGTLAVMATAHHQDLWAVDNDVD